MTTTTIAGPDGVVALSVPFGAEAAGRIYEITITPKRPTMSPAEWHAFVDRTAGSISDPSFERHGQPALEVREPLS